MLLSANRSKLGTHSSLDKNIYVGKIGVTSGGSRSIYKFFNKLPITLKYKKLRYRVSSKSGRGGSGRVIMRTRKSLKYRFNKFNINYSYRCTNISFVSNIVILPFTLKLVSLVFNSSGGVSYVPTSYSHDLFSISKLYRFSENINKVRNRLMVFGNKFLIQQGFFLVKHLQRNRPVSMLELLPSKGIQYVRSPGSSSKIIRMEFNNNTALVILPSGVRKVFSVFSIGSKGIVPIKANKYIKNNKSGYYRNNGRKSIVRGVAMNPIDHPHGGRTKTLNYPRTPWGKTTKYK